MITKIEVSKGLFRTVYSFDGLMATRHRTNGPAQFYNDNSHEKWFLFGERHRYYGPAENWDAGYYEERGERWVIHGKHYQKI